MTPFARLVLDVLDGRALSAHEIARSIDRAIPGALRGREGAVYPSLLQLERAGQVIPTWEMRDQGRRRVYRSTLRPSAEPSVGETASEAEAPIRGDP
jgi:DNA-binding PadR family transcriptional regulator